MSNVKSPDIILNASMRIDKLLYYLRFAKSRSVAQKMAQSGFIRINGQRVEQGHAQVHIPSYITMLRGEKVIVILINNIPKRRGPSTEAKTHYIVVNSDD